MKLDFKINCIFCNTFFNNAIKFALHLKIHKISSKEYYDKYLKKETEGFCKVCGKETKLYSITTGYRQYCSVKCKNEDNELKNKIKETNKKLYGGTGFASEELNKKGKETCLRIYGDKNYNNIEKAIKTNLEKYGVSNPSKAAEIREKIENTNLNKYGSRYFSNPEKCKITKKKRYNDEKFNNIEKIKQTCLEKYNVDNIMKTKEFREKSRKTCLEKYNVEYPTQNKEIINKVIKKFYENIDKHKIKKSKYFYNNIYFDSRPELAYYIWLKDNNINFEYHPNIKLEYYYENKKHIYEPDFLVNNELHEIKGLHFFINRNPLNEMCNPYNHKKDKIAEAKHQCMIKNNVKIIFNFNKYYNFIDVKYGKTYLDNFKV